MLLSNVVIRPEISFETSSLVALSFLRNYDYLSNSVNLKRDTLYSDLGWGRQINIQIEEEHCSKKQTEPNPWIQG